MNILGWIDPLPYQRMARRGRSVLAGGVDNHLDLDVLDAPVAWLQHHGLRCCGAQNWWGRSYPYELLETEPGTDLNLTIAKL